MLISLSEATKVLKVITCYLYKVLQGCLCCGFGSGVERLVRRQLSRFGHIYYPMHIFGRPWFALSAIRNFNLYVKYITSCVAVPFWRQNTVAKDLGTKKHFHRNRHSVLKCLPYNLQNTPTKRTWLVNSCVKMYGLPNRIVRNISLQIFLSLSYVISYFKCNSFICFAVWLLPSVGNQCLGRLTAKHELRTYIRSHDL